jgi:hypothetical protein
LALFFYAAVTVGFFLRWVPDATWLNALEWCLAIYLGANAIKGIPDALARDGVVENGDNKFFDWFGGRKMFLAIVFVLTICAAFFIPADPKFLTVDQWIGGLEWCLAIYLGANVVSAVPEFLTRKTTPEGIAVPTVPVIPSVQPTTPPTIA